MRLPNSTTIVVGLNCNECNAVLEKDAKINATKEAANELREAAAGKGWQPLMLGKHCVGVLCASCVTEAMSDDDETTSMDAESETESEAVPAEQENDEGYKRPA